MTLSSAKEALRTFTVERGYHRRHAVMVREGDRITDIYEADSLKWIVRRAMRTGAAFARAQSEAGQ